MPSTLKSEERDALFFQVSLNLDLLGDLQMAISKGNEEECYKLGRRVSDALRLMIEGGLGWRERTQGSTVLTLPDQEVRQIVTRVQRDVMAAIEHKRPEHEESRSEWEELAAIKDACQSVLNQARS
jgi:hypothetical protein